MNANANGLFVIEDISVYFTTQSSGTHQELTHKHAHMFNIYIDVQKKK